MTILSKGVAIGAAVCASSVDAADTVNCELTDNVTFERCQIEGLEQAQASPQLSAKKDGQAVKWDDKTLKVTKVESGTAVALFAKDGKNTDEHADTKNLNKANDGNVLSAWLNGPEALNIQHNALTKDTKSCSKEIRGDTTVYNIDYKTTLYKKSPGNGNAGAEVPVTVRCRYPGEAPPPPPALKNAVEAGYGKDTYTDGTFECSLDENSTKLLELNTDKIVIKKNGEKGKVDAWTSLKLKGKVYKKVDTTTSEAKDEDIGAVGDITNKPNDLDSLGHVFQERAGGDKKSHDLVLQGTTSVNLGKEESGSDASPQVVKMTCKETKGKGGDPEKPKEKTCCEKYCCAITFGVIGGVALIGGIAAYFLLANKGDDAGDEEEEEEDEEGEGDEE